VTADDFGLAPEVNDAVETAHRDGILTAASLMMGGGAVDDAVRRARRLPTLKVGLHLVLVEGHAVASPSLVPDLVDSSGCFRKDMLESSLKIFASPGVRRQVATEIAAQFAAFLATGLELDHVDAHKHFHLHPTVAEILCRVGERYGMQAVRAPVEPEGLVAEVERSAGRGRSRGVPDGDDDPGPGAVSLRLTRLFAWRLSRQLHRRGLKTADRVFGVKWSGALDERRLAGLVGCLPDGVTEIYCHPATSDRFEGAAARYRYAQEFAALLSSGVAEEVRRRGIVRTAYSEL
jgi:hopanoid biosynthesis associated protein HpnK